jgi:hypothetical protein
MILWNAGCSLAPSSLCQKNSAKTHGWFNANLIISATLVALRRLRGCFSATDGIAHVTLRKPHHQLPAAQSISTDFFK